MPGTYTATVTVACTIEPTQKKSDKVEVVVPTVKIVHGDGSALGAPDSVTVAVLATFKVKVTPALPGATYQWSIGGDNQPKANVALQTYSIHLYGDRGAGFKLTPTAYAAGDLQKEDLQAFFTAPQAMNVALQVNVSKGGNTYPATGALKVALDSDPNKNIYARVSPDKAHNPDDAGGFYEVTERHANWHNQTEGVKWKFKTDEFKTGKYDEVVAIIIFVNGDSTTLAQADRDTFMKFQSIGRSHPSSA